ncbi:serine hydroxymethyltransferase [Streptococcus pneumoniae]|nr:serine hydroxymethyltransferase [Streptococcus pneumoniae]
MIFDKDDFKAYDADLWNAIAKEEERQQNNIELIASENVVSKAVMAAKQICRGLPRTPLLWWN